MNTYFQFIKLFLFILLLLYKVKIIIIIKRVFIIKYKMKKEAEKPKKEENKYLFYTQYYLIAGVYHVVNVVNNMLSYSASYSSGVKEYLEEKVLLKKTIIDEIIADENKKKYEFDEDDYVIIKMRKAPISSSASVVLPVLAIPKTFENNENSNAIIDEIVNDIISNAILSATVDAVVNDIINNAVDLYYTKEGLKGNVVPFEEGLKGNVVPFEEGLKGNVVPFGVEGECSSLERCN